MNSDMWRTAYISRSVHDFSGAELKELGRRSARLNAQAGVTGLLLFDGAGFVQALEGSRSAVEATMERIRADERHDDVSIVSDVVIAQRQFGSWSMKVHRLDDKTAFEWITAEVEEDLAAVEDTQLRAIFATFGRLSRFRLTMHDDRVWTGGAEARALHLHLRLLIEQAQEARRGTYALR